MVIPIPIGVSDAEALESCANTHSFLHAACWLGIDALALGRRSEAKELFEKVVETQAHDWIHFRWAEVFLDRIDDADWLRWLPNDGSLDTATAG